MCTSDFVIHYIHYLYVTIAIFYYTQLIDSLIAAIILQHKLFSISIVKLIIQSTEKVNGYNKPCLTDIINFISDKSDT